MARSALVALATALGALDEATSCDPGSIPHGETCAPCQVGRYQPIAGASACIACETGKYGPDPGLLQCTQCVAGQYQPGEESTSCHDCATGRYEPGTGAVQCTLCDAGSINPNRGSPYQSDCTLCQVGQYQPAAGQTVCDACPAGTYADERGAASHCKTCARGTHQPTTGAVGCITCGHGQYQSRAGSSGCASCPAGTYQDGLGTDRSACTDCAAGKHQHSVGADACIACPTGTEEPERGSARAQCQDCTGGRYSDQPGTTSCHGCARGSYQPGSGYNACISCPAGQYGVEDTATTACELCAAGEYQSVVGQTSASACIDCTAGQYQLTVLLGDQNWALDRLKIVSNVPRDVCSHKSVKHRAICAVLVVSALLAWPDAPSVPRENTVRMIGPGNTAAASEQCLPPIVSNAVQDRTAQRVEQAAPVAPPADTALETQRRMPATVFCAIQDGSAPKECHVNSARLEPMVSTVDPIALHAAQVTTISLWDRIAVNPASLVMLADSAQTSVAYTHLLVAIVQQASTRTAITEKAATAAAPDISARPPDKQAQAAASPVQLAGRLRTPGQTVTTATPENTTNSTAAAAFSAVRAPTSQPRVL